MSPAVRAAKRGVLGAGRVWDRVLPPPAGVTVLIYHRVGGGSDSAVDLPVEQFDAQLAHLVAHHRVLSIDEALAELGPGSGAAGWHADHGRGDDGSSTEDPCRPVVVTFDDGTDDFVDVAVPLLQRHRVPATMYVATRFVDEQVAFPWGASPATWSALADAVSTGLVTIGSHTHTHRLLDRLDPADVGPDLDRSIDLIGEHLGVRADHFAYPKAVPGSPAAEVQVRRRFRSATLAGSRVNRPGSTDAHRIWRTPVQRGDTSETFARKADGGLRLEGAVRERWSALRYRGLET